MEESRGRAYVQRFNHGCHREEFFLARFDGLTMTDLSRSFNEGEIEGVGR